jgi:hypothetical protein
MNTTHARKAVVAALMSLSIAAVTLGSAATANANAAPAPVPTDKKGPVSFCSVFGGDLPVIGRLPFCNKKNVEEKKRVEIEN